MRPNLFRLPFLRRRYRGCEGSVRWLSVEYLEDRTVPAVVLWDGGAGTTNWQDAQNWSTDALPGATDDVQILGAGSTVNLSSGTANVTSVLSDRGLDITGGGLIANTLQVNNVLNVGLAGSISLARILPGSGTASVTFNGGSLFGVQLDAAATELSGVNINPGFVLNNRLTLNSRASFVSTQTVAGTGDFYFATTGATMWSHGDGTALGAATLTIGAGITVHGSQTGNLSAVNPSFDSFVNQGTINADTAARTINFSKLVNQGTINASAGTISLTTGWTNTGTLKVSGGTMTIGSGTNSWTNSGIINLTAGTLNLSGQYTQADLGTFNRSGSVGVLRNTGTLIGDLTLTAYTGGIAFVGGTMKNGTYSATGAGVRLAIESGTLDNVTLGTDLSTAANFTIKNGLNLNNHVWVHSAAGTSTVTFAGTQTITGPGEIQINGHTTLLSQGSNSPATASIVTIGANILVHGTKNVTFAASYSTRDRWINQGVISADTADRFWTLGYLFNQGTINVFAGSLTYGTDSFEWMDSGNINLEGGNLCFGGKFTQAQMAFHRTGGTIYISGTLTGDLVLDSSFGTTVIVGSPDPSGSSGTLKNCTYTDAGASLTIRVGTLDNVTLGGNLTSTGVVYIKNGINLNSHIWTHNGNSVAPLIFSGTQSIAGAGEIRLSGVLRSNGGNSVATAANVTIGSDVLIYATASGAILSQYPAYDRIINNGSIVAAQPVGTNFTLQNVDNYGLVQLAGGNINLNSNYNQYSGETRLSGGATSTFGGSSYTTTIAGGILTGSGTISGNLINQADISPGIETGNSIGTIAVTGTYTQQATGRLIAEIVQGTARDQLNVTKAATIAGSLIINHQNNNVLVDSATYPVLTGSSISGTFANVIDGDLTDQFTYSLSYSSKIATITVHVELPVAGITGIGNVVRSETVTYTLTATDSSSAVQAAGFTFNIDWNNDGVVDQTVVGPSGTTVTHIWDTLGSSTISVTATDKDGGVGPKATLVQNVMEYMTRANGGFLDLIWSGSNIADYYTFNQESPGTYHLFQFDPGSGDPTAVYIDVATFSSVTGTLRIYGGAGDDSLVLLGINNAIVNGGDGNDGFASIAQPAGGATTFIGGDGDDQFWSTLGNDTTENFSGGDGNDFVIFLDGSNVTGTIDLGNGNDLAAVLSNDPTLHLNILGGADNDFIIGGVGADTIDGGTGNDFIIGDYDTTNLAGSADLITGGDGNDIIIGGGGADSINGGLGQDLIIAGRIPILTYVPQGDVLPNYQGYQQVWDIWNDGDTLANRQAQLQGTSPSFLEPQYDLQPGSTMLDDGEVDSVLGGSDGDWLVYDFAQDSSDYNVVDDLRTNT